MNAFAAKYGWAVQAPVGEDGSPRRYYRVTKNRHSGILMDCSCGTAPGHALSDFIRIARWLNDIGLKAPEVYESDEAAGFAIVEDFGDLSFKKAMEQGMRPLGLYALAADVLKHLAAQDCQLALPDYYDSHVHQGRRRIIDWYMPAVSGRKNPDGVAEEYLSVWGEIEKSLPPCPQGFLHIDFHTENLMVLPKGEGVKHCGILDFQGAMRGPLPYDLVNLLEDARTDVPENIRAAILKEYGKDFQLWYRVLGTQFHCRVIGQFIKMALQGKPAYLGHIPRLENYIRAGLRDPVLAPLKAFFSETGLDFQGGNDLNVAEIAGFIREEAF